MESMIRGISRRDAELALTNGSLFTTEEALNIGLIDEVATDKNDAILKANSFLQSAKVSGKI
jgi:3,2-trans-enoyl-CoA isomerase